MLKAVKMMDNLYLNDFTRGIFKENPTFRLVLGMCPTLAITVLVKNGLGMGLAVVAVLACSNVVISSLRRFIPEQVRIPCYIVIIATFVTIIEMVLQAFIPALYDALRCFCSPDCSQLYYSWPGGGFCRQAAGLAFTL